MALQWFCHWGQVLDWLIDWLNWSNFGACWVAVKLNLTLINQEYFVDQLTYILFNFVFYYVKKYTVLINRSLCWFRKSQGWKSSLRSCSLECCVFSAIHCIHAWMHDATCRRNDRCRGVVVCGTLVYSPRIEKGVFANVHRGPGGSDERGSQPQPHRTWKSIRRTGDTIQLHADGYR